jgi:aminobenzoyl-glutamate utilization protein B
MTRALSIAAITATLSLGTLSFTEVPLAAQQPDAKLASQKADAVKGVDEMAKLAQEMVDSVFSFGELGMQEVETSKYLTAQLEKFGFKVTRGQSGIPTAWVATYG